MEMTAVEKIIDGKKVSDYYANILKEKIARLDKKLKLVVIQVGNDEASNVYVNKKRLMCQMVGIDFLHIKYKDILEDELIEKIKKLNEDDSVTGILVQFPLPKNINEQNIISAISPLKDVDGLTSTNFGNLYTNNKSIIPCTALGIIKLLEYYNIELDGKKVVLVGSSKLVGIPLIKLFLDRKCSVSICNIYTKDVKSYTKDADIIVSATGVKGIIKEDMIKDDSILIDVGIIRENNHLYGDVDSSCYLKCNMYTPVPQGVGPMTVVMLMANVLECYLNK